MNAGRLPLGLAAALSAFCVACSSDEAPGNATYSREKLMDPQTCAECHPKHHEEWSGSMHAYASEDPVFLAMNARGQQETNGELGDFCVKCHAPLAVQEKATTDGLNMESVPKHLQGVTCYFCHQVEDVADVHPSNNPLVLANDTTMRGSIKDPVEAGAHRSEYSPFLDNNDAASSSRACGACHDIVIPGHFSGLPPEDEVKLEQTYAEWQTTTFAVPGPTRQSCGDCHVNAAEGGPQPVAEPPNSSITMPVRDARHQHRFFAVDTALTPFPDTTEQANRVREGLDGALRVELCVVVLGGAISVSLENLLGGHNFPSGASHDRRLWAELHVFENGVDVYQSGVVPPGEAVTKLLDDGQPLMAWWDKATKLDGSDAHMFWDVANVNRDPKVGSIPGLRPGFDQQASNIAPPRVIGVGDTGVSRPSRVTVTLWLEPVGIDVIEDLMHTGHLPDDAVKDTMPRHALLPKRIDDGITPDPPITIAWDLDRIRDPDAYPSQGSICFETTSRPGLPPR